MDFSATQIKQIRQETTGTKHVIHFNNAGAALMPDAVRDAMIGYLQHESMYGGYETEAIFNIQREHTYDAIAELINANRDEIAIVGSATNAWHSAFHSLNFSAGDIILVANASYATNYISFLQLQQKIGVVIQQMPNDEVGQVDIRALENMITTEVKLIAITHIPTNSGLINPAEAIGTIANLYGIPSLLDACQSVGHIPIDVKAIGCDFLSATGRKYLRGPRGTGFLYVNQSWLTKGIQPPVLDLHSAEWVAKDKYILRKDARRFEVWEGNRAAEYALGLAIDYSLSIGMERISERLRALAATLRDKLTEIEGITVHDIGKRKGGIISFSVEGKTKQAVQKHLAQHKINVSLISSNGTLLDSQSRNLSDDLVRASVHYYNTTTEIEEFCKVIKTI